MKKISVLSAVGLLAAAGTVNAQNFDGRLELRIVPQTTGGTTTPTAPVNHVSTAADVPASTANAVQRIRRFEIQYRLIDNNLNEFNFIDSDGDGTNDFYVNAGVPAGLSSLQMNIVAAVSGGTVPITLNRAAISSNELNGAAPSSPDTGALGVARGLHGPFRGGIPTGGTNPAAPNNQNAANGIPSTGTAVAGGLNPAAGNTAINLVTPLSLSENGQYDGPVLDVSSQDPGQFAVTPGAGPDGLSNWFGLYTVQIEVGAANLGTDSDNDGFADVQISVATVADGVTGNRFGAFYGGDPVPRTSANANSASASFRVEIPAPGSLALLGLGGLVAARRRRA